MANERAFLSIGEKALPEKKEIQLLLVKTFEGFVESCRKYQKVSQRCADELPWLYQCLGDREGLMKSLLHLPLFVKLSPEELKYYWTKLGVESSLILEKYLCQIEKVKLELESEEKKEEDKKPGDDDGWRLILDSSKILGDFFFEMGFFEEAVVSYEKAKNFTSRCYSLKPQLEGKPDDFDGLPLQKKAEFAALLNNYANGLTKLNRLDEALVQYHISLPLSKEAYGEISSHVAELYNNIGIVMINTDLEMGEKWFEKALDVYRQFLEPSSLQVLLEFFCVCLC